MERKWLSQLRKSKKLTQQHVASSSFIDRSYYSMIENGNRNPSFTVAKNIAKVLDIDPLVFFNDSKEFIWNTEGNTEAELGISNYFNNIESGRIVYLYEDFDEYIFNALTFLISGVTKGNHCLFIGDKDFLTKIHKKAGNLLPKEQIKKHFYYLELQELVSHSPDHLIQNIKEVIFKLDDQIPLFLWVLGEQVDLHHSIWQVAKQLNTHNMLVVDSYNSQKISAKSHLQMIRNFEYLMTDHEIVKSPYHTENQTKIYPSLYLQEE